MCTVQSEEEVTRLVTRLDGRDLADERDVLTPQNFKEEWTGQCLLLRSILKTGPVIVECLSAVPSFCVEIANCMITCWPVCGCYCNCGGEHNGDLVVNASQANENVIYLFEN